MTPVRVVGSRRHFHASASGADGAARDVAQQVWRLWTTPATWGRWDRGLREAHLDGPFVVGAQGTVTDLNGRISPFRVTALETGRRCVYEVPLIGARLVLQRTVEQPVPAPVPVLGPVSGSASGPGSEPAVWSVRHDVAFVGPTAWVWALLLGRGFRRRLGPTVDALLALASDPSGA